MGVRLAYLCTVGDVFAAEPLRLQADIERQLASIRAERDRVQHELVR